MKKMRDIVIKSIPHDEQRYDTGGDYWVDENGVQQVTISHLGDWRYEFLVAIHELIELALCEDRGISEESICDFDKRLLVERPEVMDPGSEPDAPYRKEHMFAMKLERMLCEEFGIDWDTYDAAFDKLEWRKK